MFAFSQPNLRTFRKVTWSNGSNRNPLLVVIWGGAAWWLVGNGDTGWSIFVAAWGLLVSTVDNFIRPWLVSFGAEMPLILIFLGVLGGFFAFGFLGLFIGPTLLGVFYKLLQAWRALPGSSTS